MKFTREELLNSLSATIAGTCTYSSCDLAGKALNDAIFELMAKGRPNTEYLTDAFQQEVDAEYAQVLLEIPNVEDVISEHLAEVEQECCETCGWWNYPGELGCCADEDE